MQKAAPNESYNEMIEDSVLEQRYVQLCYQSLFGQPLRELRQLITKSKNAQDSKDREYAKRRINVIIGFSDVNLKICDVLCAFVDINIEGYKKSILASYNRLATGLKVETKNSPSKRKIAPKIKD